MGVKEENILNKICRITESDAGLVFKTDGLDRSIIFSGGILKLDDKNLQAIMKTVSGKKEPTLTEIKQSKAFKAFVNEYGYKTFYKELFCVENKSNYYLVLFSKNKMKDIKKVRSGIVSLLNGIKKRFCKHKRQNRTEPLGAY